MGLKALKKKKKQQTLASASQRLPAAAPVAPVDTADSISPREKSCRLVCVGAASCFTPLLCLLFRAQRQRKVSLKAAQRALIPSIPSFHSVF